MRLESVCNWAFPQHDRTGLGAMGVPYLLLEGGVGERLVLGRWFRSRRWRWLPCLMSFLSSQVVAQTVTPSGSDAARDFLVPLVSQLGLGAVIGFCVGLLLKKVGKIVAIIVGLAFVFLQILAHYEIVVIQWEPIQGWWDQSTTPAELRGYWATVRSILFANIPALGGAIPAFILGLKIG